MCGISAYLGIQRPNCPRLQKSAAALTTGLNTSLDITKHRGPDARGVWMSPDAKVGAYLLSISLLSPDYWVVVIC